MKHTERFNGDFEHNKKVLQELINAGVLASPSKRIRNKVAGYLVRAVRPTHNPNYKPAPEKPQRRMMGRGRGIRRGR